MGDLLPCPFCGNAAELNDYTDKPVAAWVLSHKVSGCLLRIVDNFHSREAAIAAWNTRALPAASPADSVDAPAHAEPVAWMFRRKGASEADWDIVRGAEFPIKGSIRDDDFDLRPLYAHPSDAASLRWEVARLTVSRFEVVTERNALQARAEKAEAERDAALARGAEVERLIHEVSDPDFLWGAMDNVNDMDADITDFAEAASRAIRAALTPNTAQEEG